MKGIPNKSQEEISAFTLGLWLLMNRTVRSYFLKGIKVESGKRYAIFLPEDGHMKTGESMQSELIKLLTFILKVLES